jgi:hypothetical protein
LNQNLRALWNFLRVRKNNVGKKYRSNSKDLVKFWNDSSRPALQSDFARTNFLNLVTIFIIHIPESHKKHLGNQTMISIRSLLVITLAVISVMHATVSYTIFITSDWSLDVMLFVSTKLKRLSSSSQNVFKRKFNEH